MFAKKQEASLVLGSTLLELTITGKFAKLLIMLKRDVEVKQKSILRKFFNKKAWYI